MGTTEPGRLSAAECDAVDHIAVEYEGPRPYGAGTPNRQRFLDVYHMRPGSTQEDLAVFVHTYVTSSANAYDDWSEHVTEPHHPQNGTRIFDQSWRIPGLVIDNHEYIAICITDRHYFEGCSWIFADPLGSGVTVQQLRNPCR